MRFIRPMFSAIAIGATAGFLIGAVLIVAQNNQTLTPAQEELAGVDHLQGDLAAWQEAIDNGQSWDGPTPYVPPEASWPMRNPWLVGFVAGDVVALIAWLILVRSVFASAPLPGPTADPSSLPPVVPLDRTPTLRLVRDTSTRPFPHTPAD